MKAKEELKQYGIDELINELGQFTNEIKALKKTVPADEFIGDARHVALSAMQMTIIPIIFNLKCIEYTANNTERTQLGNFVKMTTQELTYHHDNLTKSTLQIFFHFKIENLFTNILMAINPAYKGRGFETILNDLLNAITIGDKEDKKNSIKALSNLRNGFHNNGVHRNADFKVTVDCIDFEFIKGEVIKSQTFDVIKLLKHIVKIIADIINTAEVLALPIPIIDVMNTKYVIPTKEDFLNNSI